MRRNTTEHTQRVVQRKRSANASAAAKELIVEVAIKGMCACRYVYIYIHTHQLMGFRSEYELYELRQLNLTATQIPQLFLIPAWKCHLSVHGTVD